MDPCTVFGRPVYSVWHTRETRKTRMCVYGAVRVHTAAVTRVVVCRVGAPVAVHPRRTPGMYDEGCGTADEKCSPGYIANWG